MAKSALRNIAYEKELLQIAESGQEEVQWEDFEQETNMLLENHQYEIAYLRSKLKFIKSKGNATELQRVTAIAQNFMQKRCIAELVKLLNTNFHSGQIYWSIAKLYKSMWMLESSTEWFELAMKEGLDRQAKASCFVEIADNQIWQKQEYQKAIELVKTAIELSGKKTPKALATLAYAFLLKGETVNARRAISGLDLRASYDATFVAGLIEYRDGLTSKAKEIWKPIITAKSDDLRVHVLKKQVREFYYEGSPLWKQSAS
jgi:tetratricopeptide (TPR) repeat protein